MNAGSAIAPALALGAVMLYGIGAVRTAGRLRAADVPPPEGFSLIPLETHFVNGLGVLLSPAGLLLVVGMCLMLLSDVIADADQPPLASILPVGSRTRVGRRLIFTGVAMMIAGALIGPWWTFALVLAAVAPLALGPRLFERLLPAMPFRTALTLSLIIGTLLSLGLAAYLYATPPPNARIFIRDAQPREGALLSHSNGAYYLRQIDSNRLYEVIPQDRVLSVDVSEARRKETRSVLRLIGIPLGEG